MNPLLRGKKTSLKNFTENFTKVPNIILHAEGLTAVEKLILIELQSYSTRPNYVLAYTRIAEDLKIDKSNLIVRWKSLIERNIIQITPDDRYTINYDAISQVGLTHMGNTNMTSETQVGLTHTPILVKPTLHIGKTHLEGSVTPAIEEEIKEDKEIKNKEHNAPGSEPSPAVAATVHPGADEEKIRNFVERIPLDVLKGFEDMSFNKFLELTENDIKDYSLQLKYFQSIQRRIENLSQEKTKGVLHPEIKKKEIFNPEIIKTEIKKEGCTSTLNRYDDDYWIKEKKEEVFNP